MGIEGMNGAGMGGLEAFQKLRAQAREKLTQANPQSALEVFKKPTTGLTPNPKGEGKAKLAESVQGNFAAAKAEVLRAAVNYQRTGETDKAQKAPRLGQYVDLVA